jgi:YrbI family 3-deoxy-D-manno-octulosonate 8-phosphate phosphatase
VSRWKELPAELHPHVHQLIVRLRKVKDRSELSTRQLATKTGYSAKSWQRYLNGRSLPPREAVEAMARAAGDDVPRLLVMHEIAAQRWAEGRVVTTDAPRRRLTRFVPIRRRRETDGRMTVVEHLSELRSRMVICIIAVVIAGTIMFILSTEVNPVVRARADKLRVPVLHGIDDKESALRGWAADAGIPLAEIAYLGNDVNDLPALRIVGWPIAVANAHPLVLEAARVVLRRRGGHGAVRELIERVLPG